MSARDQLRPLAPATAGTLLPGFAEPVPDAQSAFRAVLEAMSRPGRVQHLPRLPAPPAPLLPAASAVLLALVDSATPVHTDAGAEAEAWLSFHAGCPMEPSPGSADFVLATGSPPALAALRAGTDEDPQLSATLILQVEGLEEGDGWRLRGPGIEHAHRLRVTGAPPGLVAEWAANAALFPRGVDLILCAGDRVAALPRTTRIEEG